MCRVRTGLGPVDLMHARYVTKAARQMASDEQLANVTFRQGDIYHLPYRTTRVDGTFCYSFFKAICIRP